MLTGGWQERRRAAMPKGKLAEQLEQQKIQSRTEALTDMSREERLRREADRAAGVQHYN